MKYEITVACFATSNLPLLAPGLVACWWRHRKWRHFCRTTMSFSRDLFLPTSLLDRTKEHLCNSSFSVSPLKWSCKVRPRHWSWDSYSPLWWGLGRGGYTDPRPVLKGSSQMSCYASYIHCPSVVPVWGVIKAVNEPQGETERITNSLLNVWTQKQKKSDVFSVTLSEVLYINYYYF